VARGTVPESGKIGAARNTAAVGAGAVRFFSPARRSDTYDTAMAAINATSAPPTMARSRFDLMPVPVALEI
jgi:hypothetical protein